MKQRLQVNSDIYALPQVQEWFGGFQGVPRKIWLQCHLVLTEAFANVVEHAHAALPEQTPVEIEVEVTPQAIVIRIWDWGPPFDLQQELQRRHQEQHEKRFHSVEDLPTGGRGLLITDAIADVFLYDRQPDGRNCLLFRKNFD
ncbi:MAG: anti-sigma regulatory factor [Oscillatoriales cyanobacterium SM2_1_8]|nr:anti-sigma regulatory factor [Oscillatoriales cyanobacterium SM2_1_8]